MCVCGGGGGGGVGEGGRGIRLQQERIKHPLLTPVIRYCARLG